MEKIVQVADLRKVFSGRPAVKDISFQIQRGQTLALLGPNGAGKSTTINILSTSVAADSGLVKINSLLLGRQNREIQKQIGVVFQDGVLDDLLTVEENLCIRGRFYGLKGRILRERVLHTAEMTGIQDLLLRPYGQLSGGQRRRCDIARSLLHLPKLLILDEPTTGLDPEMRRAVWSTIGEIKANTHMTILLTTHYMEEAAIADHIVIMKDGSIAATGSPTDLKARYSKDRLILFSNQRSSLCRLLDKNRIHYRHSPVGLEISLPETRCALPLLELCSGTYSSFEVLRGSMDDAYLSVIRGAEQHA